MGELFSGPGGMALGAKKAARETGVSLDHVWANDIDPDTCATYRTNIEIAPENVHCGDVRNLDLDGLEDIDGFAFGFPCNDFSSVGENLGLSGKFGPLYREGIKVLDAKQPRWFVAENVPGLRSSNNGLAYKTILSELEDSGYAVTPHLYRFEEYDVPQTRRRIIFVGIHRDLEMTFRVPAPTTSDVHPTVESALAGIPSDAPNHDMPRHSAQVVDRLRHIDEGNNAFNSNLPDDLKLNVKGATLSNIYRRLDRSRPSYTVTGSGGGGTHIYHWDEDRALTNRERATLQTFPPDFKFEGRVASVRKQVGMAVPVNGAQAVFEALFKTLRGEPYETVSASTSKRVDSSRGKSRIEEQTQLPVAP